MPLLDAMHEIRSRRIESLQLVKVTSDSGPDALSGLVVTAPALDAQKVGAIIEAILAPVAWIRIEPPLTVAQQ